MNKQVQRIGTEANNKAYRGSSPRTLIVVVSIFLEGAATFVTTDVVAAGAAEGAGAGVVADVLHYLSTLNTGSPITWIRFDPYPCIFSFFKIRIVQLFPSLPGWGKDEGELLVRRRFALLLRS